jgi:hypothetical protein
VGVPYAPGAIFEVYPAGALAMWGLPHRGYKHPRGHAAATSAELRATILATVQREAPWLALTGPVRDALAASDHALDAFVAAIVPGGLDSVRTAREGWIHLPTPDALGRLREVGAGQV